MHFVLIFELRFTANAVVFSFVCLISNFIDVTGDWFIFAYTNCFVRF